MTESARPKIAYWEVERSNQNKVVPLDQRGTVAVAGSGCELCLRENK